MSDTPWPGDAYSLVEAFRSGERTPREELEATLAAVERSPLNAFSHIDADRALAAADTADVSAPLGGVPVGVKELDSVAGWPDTGASLPLRDNVSDHDATVIGRLREAGAVLFGMTTASEFGGVNLTRTKLNGITRNPWNLECTPGGSSGGAAAAVAGGLITIGTGGDGGGSIRIPAGFTGLLGLKATYGRYPKGPHMSVGSMTAVWGCLSRSVRDTARWLDMGNGFDRRDPYSLPRVGGWEAGLGAQDLTGRTVAVAPSLGSAAVVHPAVQELVVKAAEQLAADTGLRIVDVDVDLPQLSVEWALSGIYGVVQALGERWPDCREDLTPEIAIGMEAARQMYDIAGRARIEAARTDLNEKMAALFDEVDFVIASSNPDVAFDADGPLRTRIDGQDVHIGNNGALTIPSNIYGNPAISIPAGTHDGLPVGMQVLGPHFSEALLLDLARVVERERPWPLLAPGAPHTTETAA